MERRSLIVSRQFAGKGFLRVETFLIDERRTF